LAVVEKSELSIGTMYEIAYKNDILLSATIELLTKCNWRCKHCYIPTHDHGGLKTEEVFSILEEIREMGTLELTLTGGEILLRRDILEIIKKARELHFRVYLFSNASLLNEKIIKELKQYHITQFSCTVFSMDSAIHDSVTGVRGSLKKVLENIKLLQKYNISVEVKTPIMSINKFEYKSLKVYCAENGIKYGATPTIFSRINGDHSTHLLRLSKEELREVMSDLDEMSGFNKSKRVFGKEPCTILRYIAAIDTYGNVFPCNSFYYKIGNIHESSLRDIWENSKELQYIKNISNDDLQECSECDLKNLCNRCPGIAYLEDNDLLGCSTLAKDIAVTRCNLYCEGGCNHAI
jgi:radical SAM protein with 4Fe4S-binding SPASM domain